MAETGLDLSFINDGLAQLEKALFDTEKKSEQSTKKITQNISQISKAIDGLNNVKYNGNIFDDQAFNKVRGQVQLMVQNLQKEIANAFKASQDNKHTDVYRLGSLQKAITLTEQLGRIQKDIASSMKVVVSPFKVGDTEIKNLQQVYELTKQLKASHTKLNADVTKASKVSKDQLITDAQREVVEKTKVLLKNDAAALRNTIAVDFAEIGKMKNLDNGFTLVEQKANETLQHILRLKTVMDTLKSLGEDFVIRSNEGYRVGEVVYKNALSANSLDPNAARGLFAQLNTAMDKALEETGKSLDAGKMWNALLANPQAIQQARDAMYSSLNTASLETAQAMKQAGMHSPMEMAEIAVLEQELKGKLIPAFSEAIRVQNELLTGGTDGSDPAAVTQAEKVSQAYNAMANAQARYKQIAGHDVTTKLLGDSGFATIGEFQNQADIAKMQALNAEFVKNISLNQQLAEVAKQDPTAENLAKAQQGYQKQAELLRQIEVMTDKVYERAGAASREQETLIDNQLYALNMTAADPAQQQAITDNIAALNALQQAKATLAQAPSTTGNVATTAGITQTTQEAAEAKAKVDELTKAVSDLAHSDDKAVANESGSFKSILAEVELLVGKLQEKTKAIQDEESAMRTASTNEVNAVKAISTAVDNLKQSIASINAQALEKAATIVQGVNVAPTPTTNNKNGKVDQNALNALIPTIDSAAEKYSNAVVRISDSIGTLNKSLASTNLQQLKALTDALNAQAQAQQSVTQATKQGKAAQASSTFTANKSLVQSAQRFIRENSNKLYQNKQGLSAEELFAITKQYESLQRFVTRIGQTPAVSSDQLAILEKSKQKIVSITNDLGNLRKAQETAGTGFAQMVAGMVGNKFVDHSVLGQIVADLKTITQFQTVQNGVIDQQGVQQTLTLFEQVKTKLTELQTTAQKAQTASDKAAAKAVQTHVNKALQALEQVQKYHAQGAYAIAEATSVTKDGVTRQSIVTQDTQALTALSALYDQYVNKVQSGATIDDPVLAQQLAMIRELDAGYRQAVQLYQQLTVALQNHANTPIAAMLTQQLKELRQVLGFADTEHGTGLNAVDYGVFAGINIDNVRDFAQVLEQVRSLSTEVSDTLKNLNAQGKREDATQRLARNYTDLANKMTQFAQKNSKFMSDPTLAANYNALFSDVQKGSNRSEAELAKLVGRFKSLQTVIMTTGNTGRSTFAEIQRLFQRIGGNFLISSAVFKVRSSIIDLFKTVKALDKELTNLKRVTSETDATYAKFMQTAGMTAQVIGSTMTGVVAATAEFAKLGYNLQEASTLSQNALIYAQVADMDIVTATADMVSTMKAFNIEASDSMRIVDELNEVANNYSVSAEQVGTILKKSSSTLAVSGDSMEQIVAMGTAMNEILQDEDTSGTTLKMLALRIRGAKTEIEEAGESVDGMATSTSKLRKQILALTNVDGTGGFDIMADEETFKTTYDIMKGISGVWDDMSQIDQAALLELIAGKFLPEITEM